MPLFYRVVLLIGFLLLPQYVFAACPLGSNYQQCAYNEMIQNSGSRGDDRTVSSRPNPSGGYDFSNGTTCQRNPMGGLDCRRN